MIKLCAIPLKRQYVVSCLKWIDYENYDCFGSVRERLFGGRPIPLIYGMYIYSRCCQFSD